MPEHPRDALGRPLPFDSPDAVPGPDLTDITSSARTWQVAQKYLHDGLPFHAHEVFEQRWRTCPQDERELWQALAQWAAALTHQARGNLTGAASVARAAQGHLGTAEQIPAEVEVEMVRASLRELADS